MSQRQAEQATGPDMRWFFTGLSGRIGRQPFILGLLFLVALCGVIVGRLSNVSQGGGEFLLWGFAFLAYCLFFVWACIAMAVKRLHDLNISGAVAICLFIPAVSIVAVLVLCFWPGYRGHNDYGARSNEPKTAGTNHDGD
tara:strand:+ start:6293 stop:6712 length:420 start_codon:yes stop_codon:yes gene_type:complete